MGMETRNHLQGNRHLRGRVWILAKIYHDPKKIPTTTMPMATRKTIILPVMTKRNTEDDPVLLRKHRKRPHPDQDRDLRHRRTTVTIVDARDVVENDAAVAMTVATVTTTVVRIDVVAAVVVGTGAVAVNEEIVIGSETMTMTIIRAATVVGIVTVITIIIANIVVVVAVVDPGVVIDVAAAGSAIDREVLLVVTILVDMRRTNSVTRKMEVKSTLYIFGTESAWSLFGWITLVAKEREEREISA